VTVPVVVKLGGARAVDPAGAVGDIAALTHGNKADSREVVVVHGGSTAVDDLLSELGRDPEYVETPDGVVGRFTDAEAMDAFTMALAGGVNTDLVVALQNVGVDAVGLSGVDGRLLMGPRKSAVRVVEDGKRKIRRGDHSGRTEQVNTDLLRCLLDAGHTPVCSPPMLGVEAGPETSSTNDGTKTMDNHYLAANTDADRAAARVAAALGADLVVLTDVPGVLESVDDPDSVVDRVTTPGGLARLETAAEGFMTRKVMAAREALEGGAESVTIAGADGDHPVRAALDDSGTTVLPGSVDPDFDLETSTGGDEA
jgi:acetylglutamate/LysW-gamma-L-alpha-aminoadipate kinase